MSPPGDNRPRGVLILALAGAVLLWLAGPPAGCWPLAYVGAACWLALARIPDPFTRRDYTKVWAGGVVYWLLAVNWVRWACFPLTAFGWPLLAMYLALYPLVTVAIVRRAVRRWGVPLWVAGPIAWTGMELLQARLFSGFLMAAVSHTHADQAWLRGIAAYVGAYGVTFAIVLVGATLVDTAWTRRPRALVATAAALGAIVLAGDLSRRGIAIEAPVDDPPRVALIQGDTRFDWGLSREELGRLNQHIMERQTALSARAQAEAEAAGKSLDLVVWPESMFRAGLYTFDGRPEATGSPDPLDARLVEAHRDWLRAVSNWVEGTTLLVGVDRFDRREDASEVFNSALLTNGIGKPLAIYDKTHLVPFGEYIPLAGQLPGLYYLTPISDRLRAGRGAVTMEVPLREGGVLRLCPTICYESVVPRVVRGHVAALTERGERPDALVNLTNDAWFWGASELDMHHACSVFRAVENGLPMLVAANGGLSTIIDARGETLAVSERLTEEVVSGEVPPRSEKPTPYTGWGDAFAAVCLAFCGAAFLPRQGKHAESESAPTPAE